MSSTNRGSQRVAADHYPTPSWCVHRLLETVDLPHGRWLEPCAGNGAIIDACNSMRAGLRWSAMELRPTCRAALSERVDAAESLLLGDVREHADWLHAQQPDVIITNPPFRFARDVMECVVGGDAVVVLLLRLNFLASASRATFMRRHPPDVYVLPNRPSFVGSGKTDSVEYAWFVWPPGPANRTHGRLCVLPPTPRHIRKRHEPQPAGSPPSP